MKVPIRIRVALYTAFSFAVVIIALGLILTELYDRYSYRSFDVTLQAAASSVANRLVVRNLQADISDVKEDVGETIANFENKIGVVRVIVLDAGGKEIFSFNDDKQPVPSIHFLNGRKFASIRIGGKLYRAAMANFEISDSAQGTVLAIASLSSTRDSIDRIRGLIFLVVPITILIVGLGSVVIARRALRPLEKIALDIDGIQLDRPLSRLDVPKTGDEIARVAESFNALLKRIGGLIDSQRNFLLDASHELKTPLTVIQTEIEMLLMRPGLTAEEKDNLQQLLSEVEYATKLAVDLIYLSRLESSVPMEPTVFDMDSLVKDIAAHQQPVAKRKKVSLRIKTSLGRDIKGDSELVRRALSNILENAIKFSKQNGEIWVTTSFNKDLSFASVLVEDNGIGIEPDELPRVFDRFYRTKLARSGDEKGSGLGLSIAKRIVEQHGGRITIESNSAAGTAVKIELPATL